MLLFTGTPPPDFRGHGHGRSFWDWVLAGLGLLWFVAATALVGVLFLSG